MPLSCLVLPNHLHHVAFMETAGGSNCSCRGGLLWRGPPGCARTLSPSPGQREHVWYEGCKSWFNWQSFTLCIKIIRRTSKTSMMWAGHLSLESTFTSHSASCHGAPWEAAGGLSWLGPCPRCGRQRQACAHWSPALAGGPCGTESADARSFCLCLSAF